MLETMEALELIPIQVVRLKKYIKPATYMLDSYCAVRDSHGTITQLTLF